MSSGFDISCFSTSRLIAEPLGPSHLLLLRELHSDPPVAEWLGGVPEAAAVQDFVTRCVGHWAERGFGVWAFSDRDSGRFVGRGGLRATVLDDREEAEVLYAVASRFQGRGLATEMCEASMACAFGALGFESVVGFTLPANRASRRVMEKCGLTLQGEIVRAGRPHVLYRRFSDRRG